MAKRTVTDSALAKLGEGQANTLLDGMIQELVDDLAEGGTVRAKRRLLEGYYGERDFMDRLLETIADAREDAA